MTFTLTSKQALLNYQTDYCTTMVELIDSEPFHRVLKNYLNHVKKAPQAWWNKVEACLSPDFETRVNEVVKLMKLLLILPMEEIIHPLSEARSSFYLMVEDLYNYWRKLERYAYLYRGGINEGVSKVSFIDIDTQFSSLVLRTYRRISETLKGQPYQVYRQLAAGTNVSMIIDVLEVPSLKDIPSLSTIPLISSLLFHAPFIIYPKNTKRDGVYQEVFVNPLDELDLEPNQYIGYAIKVGSSLGIVYFHEDYLNLGVSLANLFTPASVDEIQHQKVDLLYIYGGHHPHLNQSAFFVDKVHDRYIGYAPHNEEITYFGYMKKMLLTLHNLKQIAAHHWPLHGAMVSISFRSGRVKNVILVGDSGAGKSETLEALKMVAGDEIITMNVIFDDMGSCEFTEQGARAFGTETGAFVRLDDLDEGYAYQAIDRAIFMNPDKSNARSIIPVSFYDDIMRGHTIDLLVYANNYESHKGIIFFESVDKALSVFRQGQRRAKATTTEKGLVSSFYANPFGPVQRMAEYEIISQQFMNYFFDHHIPVGEIYTHLAIDGEEKTGPREVAKELLTILDRP